MNIAYKLIKIADKILNFFIYTIAIIVFLFCLYALFDTLKLYFRSSNYSVNYLKPTKEDPVKSFNRLKGINADVCAWLTIDDTSIDYPVVRGKNNAEYLNKDVYKKYSLSGSLFLDYRNSMDFTNLYSVIFGHHMNGGAMFGDVRKFKNKSFFDKHKTGTLYTQEGAFDLEIFAYIQTDAYNRYIYSINNDNLKNQSDVINFIKDNAMYYRDIKLTQTDKIIALSTCSSATTNGREVLLVRLNKN